MQSCAGCGRPHRPDVRYCTQCGRPTTASEAVLRGPTGIAAIVVLAIGLLAFLTIRPIVPRSTTSAVAVVAPASVGATAKPAVAQAVRATEVLPVPATVDASLQATQALLGEAAPTSFDPAPVALGSATAALDPATAALDPAPAALDPAPAALDTTPAAFDPTSPALDGGVPALGDPAPALDDPASAHKAAPARPSRPALPPSSSPARHAALDPTPARRVAKRQATAGRSWLGTLRAELEACDGDFIARTICRERAKFRHCGSEGAWGEVPECPAASVPKY